jgi:hypothetical protein
MLNAKHVKRLVNDVLSRVHPEIPHSVAAVDLLCFTGMVESSYFHLRQVNGPARGFWQLEPRTARDICVNFLAYRPKLANLVVNAMGGEPVMDWSESKWDRMLEGDLDAQILLARLVYFRSKTPMSKDGDLAAMARFYRDTYNTVYGRGTEEKFLQAAELFQALEG